MYKGLGIKKRFVGSNVFKEMFFLCPDCFLEFQGEPIYFEAHRFTLPFSEASDGKEIIALYRDEIRILLESIKKNKNNSVDLLPYIWMENMYGDPTCHFLWDLNENKSTRSSFFKELRRMDKDEPLELAVNFEEKDKFNNLRFPYQTEEELNAKFKERKLDPYTLMVEYREECKRLYEEKEKIRVKTLKEIKLNKRLQETLAEAFEFGNNRAKLVKILTGKDFVCMGWLDNTFAYYYRIKDEEVLDG